MGCPATSMRPPSITSSPLRQRNSVLFPEPLRPTSATTCPRSTVSDTPLRTSFAAKLLRTLSTTTIDTESLLQAAAGARHRIADGQINHGDGYEHLEWLERDV